ncbi:hypothetical protein OG898_06920 [Streptomyces sp. NBC_00193]|uniref:virginiamycin B lyase family protein n=1 Tax=Streptomyces sp. NBC_00193 TaxID=2975675 RepID=UPI00224E25C2|nr:hypothetical protein [Streptomyces sp. NBC_00193]MCX5296221.1 hypothetical protein [Streptomyces sp. NBC_00193]
MPETTLPSQRRHRAPARWRRLAVLLACTLLSVPAPAFAGQHGTGGDDGSDANPVGRIVEDGNLWFTDGGGLDHEIGRITPRGELTEFPLPTPNLDNSPFHIAKGPDGNMWFTELVGNRVGRVTVGGHGHGHGKP